MPTNNFYKKGPVGCLLVHGFTGSPNELLELGEFLASRKITVSIPTLPGHGTHSADLFNYTWRDWFAAVKAAYQTLDQACQEVFVCGLSMGGTLALHLAAHKPVNGVIALAAAVEFPRWQKVAARKLKGVLRFRKKQSGEDVRNQSAKTRLGSYRRYPYYALDQLFQLVEHVRDDLSEVTQPILIMHSRQDHTVSFANSDWIVKSVGSKDKRKVDLEQSYHVITVDVEKARVWQEVFDFIRKHSKLVESKSKKRATAKKK